MSKLVTADDLDKKQEQTMSVCSGCHAKNPPIDTGFSQIEGALYLVQATSVCQKCRTILGVSLLPAGIFPSRKITKPKILMPN